MKVLGQKLWSTTRISTAAALLMGNLNAASQACGSKAKTPAKPNRLLQKMMKVSDCPCAKGKAGAKAGAKIGGGVKIGGGIKGGVKTGGKIGVKIGGGAKIGGG